MIDKNTKNISLFGINISITNKQQALALVSKWLLDWSSVILSDESARSRRIQLASRRSGRSDINIPIAGARFFSASWRIQNDDRQFFPKIVVTPNPEMIVAAQTDLEFRKALNNTDLAIADGAGLKLANWRLMRVSGIELMEELIEQAADKKWKVMLLGGREQVAAKAAKILRITNYELRITYYSGPQNIEKATKKEMDGIILHINSIKPDLLFVAFGHGKQEKWMAKYKSQLKVGVMMGVGGAIDQIADPSLRAPSYMYSMGLGWLYRLARQPWRWRRQLALIKFMGMVISKSF